MDTRRAIQSYDPVKDFVAVDDFDNFISRLYEDCDHCENSPELETLFGDEPLRKPTSEALRTDFDCFGTSRSQPAQPMDVDGDLDQADSLQMVNGDSEKALVVRQNGSTLENWQKVFKALKFLRAINQSKAPHAEGELHQQQAQVARKRKKEQSPQESLALVGSSDSPQLDFRGILHSQDEWFKFLGQDSSIEASTRAQMEQELSFHQREVQFEAEMDRKAQEQAASLAAGREKLAKNREDIKKAYETLERKMDRHLPVLDQIFEELEKELEALGDDSSPNKALSTAAMKEKSLGLIRQGKAAVKDLRAHKATCSNKLKKGTDAIEKTELMPAKHFQEYTAVAMAFVKQHVRAMAHHVESHRKARV